MSALDAAIREQLDGFVNHPCSSYSHDCRVTGHDEMKTALLVLVEKHEAKHRRLGQPQEDHRADGLPLCQGWPYRPGQDTLCEHIRTIAKALEIKT